MSDFSLEALLDSRRGEDLDLWAQTINPQFVRVLRTIGFDRTWARAEGAYLYDADGTRYLDLLGGFGMYGVGRNNPRVRAALVEALELETPGMLAMGTTLLPGLLAEELIGLAGGRIERCLFTSSGTESVEAALKLGRAATGRTRVLSAEHGFHGLTLGSLSANGGRGVHRPLPAAPARVRAGPVRRPRGARGSSCGARTSRSSSSSPCRERASTCRRTATSQGAQELCRRYGTLFCVDEVMTGLRPHGPDVRLPALGARAGSRHGGEVALGRLRPRRARCSWRARCTRRSSTRCRTRCRTARRSRRTSSRWRPGLATLHELREQRLVEQSARLGERLLELTRPLVDEFEVVRDVRGLGLAWAIEFAEPEGGGRRTYRMIERAQRGLFAQLVVVPLFTKHHILTQVAGHDMAVIRILPPLVVTRRGRRGVRGRAARDDQGRAAHADSLTKFALTAAARRDPRASRARAAGRASTTRSTSRDRGALRGRRARRGGG